MTPEEQKLRAFAHIRAAHSAIIGAVQRRKVRQVEIDKLRDRIGELEAEGREIDERANTNLEAELMRARFPGKDGDFIPALISVSPDLLRLGMDGDRLLVIREEPNVNKPDTGKYVTHIFGPPGTGERRECVEHIEGGGCGAVIVHPSVNVAILATPEELERVEALLAEEPE